MLRVGGAAVVHPVGQRSRVGQGSRVGRSYGEAATSICGVCATCATTTPCPYLEVCIADSASAYTHAVSMMRIHGCFPGLGPPSPLSLCGASVWVAVWPFGQLVAILTIPFASHICLPFFPLQFLHQFFLPQFGNLRVLHVTGLADMLQQHARGNLFFLRAETTRKETYSIEQKTNRTKQNKTEQNRTKQKKKSTTGT